MTEQEVAGIEADVKSDPTLQPDEVARYMALVAEVRRLRGLVREALIEGVLWPLDELHAQDCWERSNARKALEGA